ncbi:hypothetical protein DYB25_005926 [Aphanomyces astaci]|uniref:Cleavage and polyadenylation specificity factor subunit 2 n=2 Tax=Aphanomyces astaci TaxID=112090 RepID=A0A397AVS1_APHAT|nr:hypothetical protein DYB25_005926 [Aphanomyces astaci]
MVAISFTPLYGVQSTERSCCYLLEVDDIGILLDCGWTDDFDVALLEPLAKVIDKVDLVLISHPDLAHMGALPYAMGTLGLKAPVYVTLPVYRMGEIVLYEAYQARTKDDLEFNLFTLDHVDQVLETFIQLKFSQKLKLSGEGEGIYITPHAAGHLIGGSIWCIAKETLKDEIVHVLRRGGDVLIPCDSAGRVLEVLHVLDQYWIKLKLKDPIALLHTMSFYTPKAAQAMLEWCSERISKNFDIGKPNPFNFTHVNLIHNLDELDRLPSPKVILATSTSLNHGFGKDLLMKMAPLSKNGLVFVSTPVPGTVAATIHPGTIVKLKVSRNVPLEGAELLAYEAKERRRLIDEAELKAKEIEEAALEDMMMTIAEYESDDEGQPPTNAPAAPMQLRGSFKVGFGQFATAKFPMFFTMDTKCEWDEYGEVECVQIIRVDEFKDVHQAKARLRKAKAASSSSKEDVDMGNGDDEDDDVNGLAAADRRPMKTVHSSQHIFVRYLNVSANQMRFYVLESTNHKPFWVLIFRQIQCTVQFVDFDGVADGRAIKNCLDNVKPRKLILVHGTPETTTELQEYVQTTIEQCEAVYTPHANECIDIESDTTVYKLSLKESLYSSAFFQKVGSHDVAYINATAEFHGATCIVDVAEQEYHTPMLLSQGKVTLAMLKTLLARAGFEANFYGGMLVCDDGVVLKRSRNNEVVMEGTLSSSYYRIRDILYQQYTLV